MKERQALSIRAKVMLTCVGLALTTGFAGGLGIWAFSRVNAAFQVVATQSLPAVNHILQADREMQQAMVAERSLMFMSMATPEAKEQTKVHAVQLTQVLERWREYSAIPASEAEQKLWPALGEAVRDWVQVSRDTVRILSEETPSSRRDAIDLSMSQGAVKFENARKILSELTAMRIEQAESHAKTEEARAAAMLWWVVSAVLGAMALALVLSFVLAHAIARKILSELTAMWLSACSIRIAVSSLRILRAFSNFTAPWLIERSMASRRDDGVSSDRILTVSRDTCTQSRTASPRAGHSFCSASLAGMAEYSRQRSSTCVSWTAWTLVCSFASGVAMLMNIRLRSATIACCISRSACKM